MRVPEELVGVPAVGLIQVAALFYWGYSEAVCYHLLWTTPRTSEVVGIRFIALRHKAFDKLLKVRAKLNILTFFIFFFGRADFKKYT